MAFSFMFGSVWEYNEVDFSFHLVKGKFYNSPLKNDPCISIQFDLTIQYS